MRLGRAALVVVMLGAGGACAAYSTAPDDVDAQFCWSFDSVQLPLLGFGWPSPSRAG